MAAQVPRITSSSVEVDRVARKLRNDIYSGAKHPRERLVEQDIAQAYSAGRMVVRQALSELAGEGLVAIEPYKGASVAEISLTRIYDNYQIVSTLEGLAASLAAGLLHPEDILSMMDTLAKQDEIDPKNVNEWHYLNKKFHRTFIYRCGNERLIELIKTNVRFTNYWFTILSIPGRIGENNEEHRQILEAFRERDSESARRLVEMHIMGAGDYLMRTIGKNMPPGMLKNLK